MHLMMAELRENLRNRFDWLVGHWHEHPYMKLKLYNYIHSRVIWQNVKIYFSYYIINWRWGGTYNFNLSHERPGFVDITTIRRLIYWVISSCIIVIWTIIIQYVFFYSFCLLSLQGISNFLLKFIPLSSTSNKICMDKIRLLIYVVLYVYWCCILCGQYLEWKSGTCIFYWTNEVRSNVTLCKQFQFQWPWYEYISVHL